MSKFTRTAFIGFGIAILIFILSLNLPYQSCLVGCSISLIILVCITANAVVEFWNQLAANDGGRKEKQRKKSRISSFSGEWKPTPTPSALRLEREPWLASLGPDEPEQEKIKAPQEEYISWATLGWRKNLTELFRQIFRLPSSRKGD